MVTEVIKVKDEVKVEVIDLRKQKKDTEKKDTAKKEDKDK